VFTGLKAVAYATLYELKTVLVDGAETAISDARPLLYSAPERVSINADYKARAWTGALKNHEWLAGVSLTMRKRDDADSRRLASSEEHAECVRIATHERSLYDAEISEIRTAGWAPSQYNNGAWYALDAQGRAIKPTRTTVATRAELLARVRGAATATTATATNAVSQTPRCSRCGHETRRLVRARSLDAQDEPTGDWHHECSNSEACELRQQLSTAKRDSARTVRRALDAVVDAAFAHGETPSVAEIAESAERIGPAARDATHWRLDASDAWQLVYNGRDGDDWSLSNCGTWIARRARRTPELEQALRELDLLSTRNQP
jgi:hypothetical protein